jgi:hypothetical protein
MKIGRSIDQEDDEVMNDKSHNNNVWTESDNPYN